MVARYNPCGRVVDIGRATGRTRARLYPDSDVEFDIEWYQARDDAPLLGCASAVNRLEWEGDRDDWLPTSVGEVFGTWQGFRYEPVRPLALGIHRCGDDADFEGRGVFNGQPPFVTYRPDGLPDCCGFAVDGLGGGVGGGEAEWYYRGPFVGLGGGVGGGSSAHWYFPPAVGGGVGGGSSPWVYAPPAVGGGVGGGSSPWVYAPPAVGGGVGGGSSASGYVVPITAEGGGVGGGSSASGYVVPITAEGGGVGGGSSEWWYFTLAVGSGGGVGGGSSEWWYFTLAVGSGGGVGGGEAEWSYSETITTEGGGVGGGEAEWSYSEGAVGCDQYHAVTWMFSEAMTRTSDTTWSGPNLALDTDGLGNWNLVQISPYATWTLTAWDGEGTQIFYPGGAYAPATVWCDDPPPP